MDKTNYLNNRIVIVLGLIVMLLASGVKYSFAANPSQMPDLRDEESTLTIETSYTDETVTTPISGVELTIYKVADLSVKNGEARYTLTPTALIKVLFPAIFAPVKKRKFLSRLMSTL